MRNKETIFVKIFDDMKSWQIFKQIYVFENFRRNMRNKRATARGRIEKFVGVAKILIIIRKVLRKQKELGMFGRFSRKLKFSR